MLNQIHIRDFATIEELHLQLEGGNTMITGETGAGKSIFIEAIELALGERASAQTIRPGKERAEISLCFDVTHFPKVITALKDLDLYHDVPECIIRRVIASDGRSRCYVNETPATLQLVKELGEMLFHLHSQYEQQVLLKAETQRDMLDRYGDLLDLVHQVKQLSEKYKSLDNEIQDLRAQSNERIQRCEYLRFQLEELDSIQLQPGEWEKLEAEHKRLTYAEALMQQTQKLIAVLGESDETPSMLSLLHDAKRILENINSIEPKASLWVDTINSSSIQIEDLYSELQSYLDDAQLDPERLQAVEARVSHIFDISRKHKITPPALAQFKHELENELHALDKSDEALKQLEKERAKTAQQYKKVADQLTQARKKSLTKLENEITTTIRSLSLPHCEFKIELEPLSNSYAPYGNERVVFLIKTNPDQSLQPLAKIISGGELSRLSLAAHLALAKRTTIPTLIFDEVDTGLSGATAEKIGKLLRKLGESYQVFGITHQAQVAACGHHHLLVEKTIRSGTTRTHLRLLSIEERSKEIARMLGGEKITRKTLEHAEELLQGI